MQRPNRTPLFTRPRHLLVALALLFAPLFGLAATPALAAPSCVTSGATVTCTFGYTGAADTWTVPAGVTSATFDLYGAQGGRTTDYQSGGLGGQVTATLAVTPGSTYQIRVGGQGGFNGGGEGGRRGLKGRDMDGARGGCQGRRTFGSFDYLVIAPLSCRTILPAHAGVTNQASRVHTSGASTSSSD